MSTEAKLWDLRIPSPSLDPTMPDATKPRFEELAKFLPVSFVFFIIFSLYSIYIFCHCLPLMAHSETYMQGWTCLVIFNVITALLLVCYLRSMLQHPGTIPDVSSSEEGEVVWEFAPQDGRASNKDTTALDAALQAQKETKRQGDRRNCKWCNKYKPDRCHHCRVCRMCILKMDHHCPWIYNCVGFKNFKYFFLLVFYAAVASNFVLWTMFSTVRNMIIEPRSDSFLRTFIVLFGESLAGLMAFLLTSFLVFHIHLMIRAMTTIEFCEKSRHPNFDNGVYSLGVLRNVQAVLGDNIFLWLLPIHPPSGNGVKFSTPADDNSMILGDESQAKLDYGSTQKGGKHGTGAGGTGEAPDSDVQQKEPTYSGH